MRLNYRWHILYRFPFLSTLPEEFNHKKKKKDRRLQPLSRAYCHKYAWKSNSGRVLGFARNSNSLNGTRTRFSTSRFTSAHVDLITDNRLSTARVSKILIDMVEYINRSIFMVASFIYGEYIWNRKRKLISFVILQR